ncbi:MAG: orotidine-5'-phosphate decarboxylase [Candidatus Doudnabacteria bacterium]
MSQLLLLQERICLALDGMDISQIEMLLRQIGARSVYSLKVHDLWDKNGSRTVSMLERAAYGRVRVWADLKLSDTPPTMAFRAKAVREAGAHSLTIHASAGPDSIKAALDNGPADVIAVTVLTSISSPACMEMHGRSSAEQVQYLADLAVKEGVCSLVCSGEEVGALREKFPNVNLIVPGVRMPGSDARGQKRIVTPWDAFKLGASRIVLGSDVTKAEKQGAAFVHVMDEIKAHLATDS